MNWFKTLRKYNSHKRSMTWMSWRCYVMEIILTKPDLSDAKIFQRMNFFVPRYLVAISCNNIVVFFLKHPFASIERFPHTTPEHSVPFSELASPFTVWTKQQYISRGKTDSKWANKTAFMSLTSSHLACVSSEEAELLLLMYVLYCTKYI